jgi:hypothetical protein
MKKLSFILTILLCHSIIAQESDPLTCADGLDNDMDGFIDCEDPDCQNLPNNGCNICFDDATSFADTVIAYLPECLNNEYTDSSQALGVSNFDNLSDMVSLGEGGYIILGFTDNLLTNTGNNDPDIYVFEVGPLIEATEVSLRPINEDTEQELSNAGITDLDEDGFYEFGTIQGSTSSIDIDSFVPMLGAGSLLFDAILIKDVQGDCSGASPGADIDAVCALSSVDTIISSVDASHFRQLSSVWYDSINNCLRSRSSESFDCEIYNTSGTKVLFSQLTTTLFLDLPSGVYFARLFSKNNVSERTGIRFVVQ